MVRLITLGRLQLLRDGRPSEPIHLQPKRLALLAYLALAATDGFQQRDTLLALFWPHSDRHRARGCLRQALFHLRNELGDGVMVNAGREGVALAPHRLWCDAAVVQEALSAGRLREALDLYAGDFLPGLFVDDCAVGLEEWVDRTRCRLRSSVVAGAWELVEDELRGERPASALETARRARGLAPDDEQGLRRQMLLLARMGDSASALGAFADFSRRLRREYDAEPGRESRALAEVLKHGQVPSAMPTEVRGPVAVRNGARDPIAPERPWRRPKEVAAWGRRAPVLALVLLAGVALGKPLMRRPTPAVGGHLVLGQFTNHTRDSLLGVAVMEALRTDLSQIAEVRVRGTDDSVVRQDTALAIVTGDVTALGPGFTVSARLVSAGDGRVLAVVREDAAEPRFLLRTVQRVSQRLRGDVLESLAATQER